MLKPYLFVEKTAEKGRGVYTHERIPANTVIEIAPVIVMKSSDREHLDKTLLHDYIFEWGKLDDSIMVKTVRVIENGEELTINYNGDWNDGKKVWFDVK